MKKKISENATIPFPSVALVDTPAKHRKNFIDDYKDNAENIIPDKSNEKYDMPMEDVEKIKILFSQYLTLFKDRDDKIEVLKRGQTDSGVLYDIYLDGGHTILYVKPEEKIIGLINRTMDKDDFADILEDIEEINVEPEERKLGKLLIGIGRAEFKPKIEIEEPEEEIETDTEEVESELDKKMEDNVEKNEEEPEEEPEETDTNDTEPTEEPETGDEESVLPTTEEEPEKESKIKKENVQKGRNNMKVKDILNEYGYVRVTDKNDVISIVEYYKAESLKDFSSFIVKIKGNDYDEIFGVCGSRFDENKDVVQVVKNGKLIYESTQKRDMYTENYDIGEVVKIDLSAVSGDYMKQIYTLSKRTKGYAIVESVEGDIVRIVENEHKARIKQSVPINKGALIKLDKIKDACVVYEDKEAVAVYQSLLNEATSVSEKNKEDMKKKESAEVSEDIMYAGFGIKRNSKKK
jgi:hypothetical protein